VAELVSRRSQVLPRSRVAPRTSSVASTVYKVISDAATPMRAKDINHACEDEVGHPVSWSTVKTCLSDHSRGTRPRFQRVAHGLYAPLPAS